MAYGLQTYDDASRREDLLSVMGDVSPDETYLTTNLKTGDASQTLHEWLHYSVSRPTSVTFKVEGAAATYSDLTQPSRLSNKTAILERTVRVSRTERKVSVGRNDDPYEFQKNQALRLLKMDMEYAIINGTDASGASGVARGMKGIDGWITTHATAYSSGHSLSETTILQLGQMVWDDINPEKMFDVLMVPMGLKVKMASTFTGNATRYIPGAEKKLVNDIMVYDSPTGSFKVIAHKDVRNVAGSVTMYGIREDQYRIAYLDKPFWEELAKDGDRENGHYVTELTLESHAEEASLKATGFSQTG